MKERKKRFSFTAAVQLAAPHTWPAAVLPVALGICISCGNGFRLNLEDALLTLVTAVCLQSAVNTLNDWADFHSGLDSAENCIDATDAALVYQDVSPAAAMVWGFMLLCFAACAGGMLTLRCGAGILWYAAAAAAAIGLYVVPVKGLKRLPTGELLSGVSMGGVLTCASYSIQAGEMSLRTALLSLPCVISVGCIMLVNNTSDIEKDKDGGRTTLSVILGRKKASVLLRALLLAAIGLGFLFLLIYYPRGAAAAAVLAASLAFNKSCRWIFTGELDAMHRMQSMAGIVAAHTRIVACYAIGILISAL